MNDAFLSVSSAPPPPQTAQRRGSYQRSAGPSVAPAVNTAALRLGPSGFLGGGRGSSRGQRAHRGSRAPLATHRTRGQAGPTLGGQVGADQGDADDSRTSQGRGGGGWPTNYAPLYVCWSTRSVHMSTSIGAGGGWGVGGEGSWASFFHPGEGFAGLVSYSGKQLGSVAVVVKPPPTCSSQHMKFPRPASLNAQFLRGARSERSGRD